MKTRLWRGLSFLVSLSMALGLVPAPALAEASEEASGSLLVTTQDGGPQGQSAGPSEGQDSGSETPKSESAGSSEGQGSGSETPNGEGAKPAEGEPTGEGDGSPSSDDVGLTVQGYGDG